MQSNPHSEAPVEPRTAETGQPCDSCPAERRRRVGWKAWLKRLVTVGAIIPLLLLLAFAGAISVIDFNQYKPQIEQEVTQRTGHELRIQGAIEVSVWPFAFSIGEVALKNRAAFAEQFGQPDLLSIKRVRVELSVWELLWHKRMVVKGLELVEPSLVLLRTQTGDNWQRLAQLNAPSDVGAEAARRYAAASQDDLRAFLEQIVPVALQAQAGSAEALELGDAQKPAMPEAETLSAPPAEAPLQQADSTALQDMPSQNMPSQDAVTLWHFDSVVVRNGRFELQDAVVNQQAEITEWNLMAFNVNLGQPFKVRTDFHYRNPLEQRDYSFDLSADLHVDSGFMRWQVSDWQGMFTLRLPEEKQVPEMRLVTEGARFSLNLREDQVQVEAMQLETLGSRLQASFSGHYGAHPNLYGVLEMQGVNLPNWARHLGVDFPRFVNAQALTEIKGQIDWELNGNTLALNRIDMVWDQSRLQGKWSRKATQPVRYGYDLQIDRLNLDDYLAYVQQRDDRTAAPSETYLPLAVPIATLRDSQVKGTLTMGHLQVAGWRFEEVSSRLQADKGIVALLPLQARLAGGEVESRFELDVNGATPAYRWQGELKQVALETLLQAAQGQSSLEGALNASFELASQGSNQAAILANLTGNVSLQASKGHIQGVDLAKLLAGGMPKAGDKTAFNSMILRGKVAQGVLDSQQLRVLAPLFEANGKLRLDLNKGRVDSELQAKLKNLPKGLEALSNVRVPLRYAGPVEQAQWSVDLQKWLR
ncbi:AsmA family protein [Thiomicrorhabdus cannonii]|uniref:AsmA family protein n=1 Tax=Thiomicrorhabdus cannonii TaxID=2748011 RepID=UPI0015C1BDF6|nr:AsmA family protein [Thiomicrorhabdus cannonii]